MQCDRPANHDDYTIKLRAAQYVRMSTDYQIYSTQNQADAIARYATERNITIVRSYSDEGRSGLRMDDRHALKQLISDVLLGRADFGLILVYDVSRWGRLQDTDESAHYEFICKEAGVRIEYCAEGFENDGSLMSAVMKNLKRAMAGEYSRELSTKVFAAQYRLVKMGFWQGGAPGFGLRRQLIDENGNPKGLLTLGQRKHLQTDRVILLPGPPNELELVRNVFSQFAIERKSESRIARDLNRNGLLNHYGRPWTSWSIRSLLNNENYIGNNLYNRKSFRMGKKVRQNSPDLWIRAVGAFEAIVDPNLFQAAQRHKKIRRISLSKREMLARLSTLYYEKGKLSRAIIDQAEFLPSHSTYITRFGSLRDAYKLIEYRPADNFKYLDAADWLTEATSNLATDITTKIVLAGGFVEFEKVPDVLVINGALTVSIRVARGQRCSEGWLRWIVRRPTNLRGDLIIAVRVCEDSRRIMDYLLLPVIGFPKRNFYFSEKNLDRIDLYRIDTAEALVNVILKSLAGFSHKNV